MYKKVRHKLNSPGTILTLSLLLYIYYDIFLYLGVQYKYLLLALFLWFIKGYFSKKDKTLEFGFFFLLLAPLLYLPGAKIPAEKSANWAFFLIAINLSIVAIKHEYLMSLKYIKKFILTILKMLRIVESRNQKGLSRFGCFLKTIYKRTNSFYRTPKSTKSRILFAIKILVPACIVSIIILFRFHQGRVAEQNAIFPIIKKVEPRLVYKGTNVIVFGDNFGWDSSTEEITLMSQYGRIKADQWTRNKIVFTIPLNMRYGDIHFWTEKKSKIDKNDIEFRSKTFTIKLIPAGQTFTIEDDQYFEELRYLEDETLKLNGYAVPKEKLNLFESLFKKL